MLLICLIILNIWVSLAVKIAYTVTVIVVVAVNIFAVAVICIPIAVTAYRLTTAVIFIGSKPIVVAVKSSATVVNCSVIAFVTLNISMTIPSKSSSFMMVTPVSYCFYYFEIVPFLRSMLNVKPSISISFPSYVCEYPNRACFGIL